MAANSIASVKKTKPPLKLRIAAGGRRLWKNIRRDKALLLIVLPVVILSLIHI